MSIKIIEGDLVKSYLNNELDAYAHQCNCFCTMKRGIAPLLVKANPEVLIVDKLTETGDRNKLGGFTKASTENKPLIYNVYGQYHWSKYKEVDNINTNYNALYQGLVAVREDLHAYQYYHELDGQMTLGLPLIGCGLAGGDWKGVVKPMIKEIFEDSGIDVTVFVLKKDLHLIR